MIFISDLHLGAGNGADDFGPANGPADRDLIAKCDEWHDHGEGICVVGDLFDLWQADLADIVDAHFLALRALFPGAYEQNTTEWVVGNHDWAMLKHGQFWAAETPMPMPDTITNEKVWVEHGHRCDPLIRKWPRTCRVVCAAFGWVERHVWADADVYGERLAGWLGKTGRHGGNEVYLPHIAKRAAEHGCDRAVFGHTHQFGGPYVVKVGTTTVTVWNSGTWTNGKRDFLRL